MRIISKKLRDSALGRDCTLRLIVCNHDPITTTLAHVPCNQKGTGMKGPDNIAIFACSACSFVTDNSPLSISAKDWLRALAETQLIWIQEGLIKIEGMK